MYLMYVDESGDTGISNSPTRYFVLTGLIIHELRWQALLDELIVFRRQLRNSTGLKLREEIHAAEMINSPGDLIRIPRNIRLDILKKCLDWIALQRDCNLISIIVDKQGKTTDIFEIAWTALTQRFENTIRSRNFPGPQNADDKGLLLPDRTDDKKLRQIIRKMRRYNPIPNTQSLYSGGTRNLTLKCIVEDPLFKDSADSLFSQMVDITSYFLKQLYDPNSYIKKKGAKNFFYRLEPVLCKYASRYNPFGIVEL